MIHLLLIVVLGQTHFLKIGGLSEHYAEAEDVAASVSSSSITPP